MRKAVVAGQFYALNSKALNKQVKSCFKHKLGGGMPRVPFKQEKIFGAVVPHAGYPYSGPCASYVYKKIVELDKKNFPDTFIILGPDHSGYAKTFFSLSLEDFETPFGLVKNDSEFGKRLIEEKKESEVQAEIQVDELAHKYEHSIEVQLPFLQSISKLRKLEKEFKIVPIIVSTLDYEKCSNMGKKISEIIKKSNKKICIIASSDFTHYGTAYGFLPFTSDKNTKNNLYELDKKSINYILKLKSKDFYEQATKTTICGAAPIIIAMETCKSLGSKKARLLKYYTSGDVTEDYSNAVGYASIVFE